MNHHRPCSAWQLSPAHFLIHTGLWKIRDASIIPEPTGTVGVCGFAIKDSNHDNQDSCHIGPGRRASKVQVVRVPSVLGALLPVESTTLTQISMYVIQLPCLWTVLLRVPVTSPSTLLDLVNYRHQHSQIMLQIDLGMSWSKRSRTDCVMSLGTPGTPR